MERKILSTWKEIASYTGRGVRTVQRWERGFHLPVHRSSGLDRSVVIAFEDEIDQWLASTPVEVGRPKAEQTAELGPRMRQLAESVHSSALTLVRLAEKLQSSVFRVHQQQQRRQQRRRQQSA